MIRKQISIFLLRTVASVFGMWICISWFANVSTSGDAFIRVNIGDFDLINIPNSMEGMLFIVAGVIFSIVNSVVKPLIKLFALPLAIVTLGISTLLINIGMMALTIYLLPGVEMDWWGILISSFIMSLINSLVNLLLLPYNKK